MPLYILDNELYFPPPHHAEPDGLLAIGGDLSTERLLLAYQSGIFPWYSGEYILWWSPDPRFVLFPEELRIKKSTAKLLSRTDWHITTNLAFEKVIRACKLIPRNGQDGTWISDEMERAYTELHSLGHAHSVEVWNENNKLVGGLYGIRMGRIFFGESMFSEEPGASRFAFTNYVNQLKEEGVKLIDCQVHTEYLESFGAKFINGKEFRSLLEKYL